MMLRVLSAKEVALVAGGEEMYPDTEGYGNGGTGGGGDYGDPQYGPSNDSPANYDPSEDPNRLGYGNDPSNPYEQGSSNQGSGTSGQTNAGLVDNSPTSSPSAPPSIGSPNPSGTYFPSASTGNGGSAAGGFYGSPTSPDGYTVRYGQKL